MKRLLRLTATVAIALTAAFQLTAQHAAIKTNILSDAALTPQAAVEARVAPHWTLQLQGAINAWSVNDHRWKQWNLMPEARYWFCQSFAGHFVGAHLVGGQFNWGNLDMDFKFLGTDFSRLKDHRFQGWMGGAGLLYGYSWILDRHWNIEALIALGWIYSRYDTYECADCGQKVETGRHHNYVGPTQAAVNLIYTF